MKRGTEEWSGAEGEWLRMRDGVRVLRTGERWKVVNASGREVLGMDGQARTWPDSETARRQCDWGALQPDVLPLYEDSDQAGLRAIIDAIRHLHGVDATWLEEVPVKETHEGKTVWEGHVQVFAVEHPSADRIYGWSHESGPGGKRRFHAVLGAPPVGSAEQAVKVAIVGDFKRAQN